MAVAVDRPTTASENPRRGGVWPPSERRDTRSSAELLLGRDHHGAGSGERGATNAAMEATVGDTISLNGALEPELEIAGRMRSLAPCARAGKTGQRERRKASADVRLDRDRVSSHPDNGDPAHA
jgi:hypothetical protein